MANLRIAELDFDQIKTNLKTFLNSQSEFTDYDFEGSGLSVLIDILAYNTHYNAYLANMVVNEMFLDSSVKRASAVSLAKHLSYTPRSTRGARAKINITVNGPTGSPAELTLNKYTPFTTTVNGTGYTFLNTQDYTIIPVDNVYEFTDVEVFEGQYFEYTYVVTAPGPGEKYVIPNSGVDTSTLQVTVQESATDLTTTSYALASDIADLDSTSEVYFLEENAQEKFEIYFGDGVIGKKLTAGNIVILRYLVSNGTAGNVSETITQSFSSPNAIGGSTDITIEVVNNSTGGAAKEDITSLKFYAPKFYASQNRAVTSKDFVTLIQQNFTQADSINVWGGEENDPPAYGRVFISLKPVSGYVITEEDRAYISNTLLASRSMLTVSPIFVEPEYLYVNLSVAVKYNALTTTSSKAAIESSITTAVNSYFTQNLQKFNGEFYYSQLNEAIKDTNSSILSCITSVNLQQRLNTAFNVSNSFDLKFSNRLHPATLQSSRFFISRAGATVAVRIKDVPDTSPSNYSGTGTLQMYDINTEVKISDVGTINYATGEVSITGIIPIGLPVGANDIRVTVEVQDSSLDLAIAKNQILILDNSKQNNTTNYLSGLTVTATSIT